MSILSEQIILAYNTAKHYHEGQKRKFTNLDYFTHPKGVARILDNLECGETFIVVALLHDALEDTKITYAEIKLNFGSRVAGYVKDLTNEKNVKNKAVYLSSKINNLSLISLTVKLADRLHNVKHLLDDDIPRDFIKKYVKETRYILNNYNNRIQTRSTYWLLKEINMYLCVLENKLLKKEKS
jgi:(p)ppGpp synthase/HD superfamily hydrolase